MQHWHTVCTSSTATCCSWRRSIHSLDDDAIGANLALECVTVLVAIKLLKSSKHQPVHLASSSLLGVVIGSSELVVPLGTPHQPDSYPAGTFCIANVFNQFFQHNMKRCTVSYSTPTVGPNFLKTLTDHLGIGRKRDTFVLSFVSRCTRSHVRQLTSPCEIFRSCKNCSPRAASYKYRKALRTSSADHLAYPCSMRSHTNKGNPAPYNFWMCVCVEEKTNDQPGLQKHQLCLMMKPTA